MGQPRPHAAWSEAEYLSLLLDEFQQQGAVLREIRDRLPVPDEGAGSQAPDAEPQPVHIAEPVPERAPARKATPAKTATKPARRSS